jgi:hypothetical protein
MTKADGSFQFINVPAGLYFLHLGPDKPVNGFGNLVYGDIAVSVANDSRQSSLSIATDFSSCGLSYDLAENKAKYRPQACFKGGHPIPCEY